MQNGQKDGLNANVNHGKHNGLVSHVRKILTEKPNITDSEMEQEIKNVIPNYYNEASRNHVDRDITLSRPMYYTDIIHHDPFGSFFRRDPFYGFDQRFNRMWEYMNRSFRDIDVDFNDIDMNNNNDNNGNYSYVKYTHSMSSYNDGNHKTKSVSGVERIKDGKRSVHKKMTTTDENGTVVEEYFPDGTKKVTSRGLNNRITSN